MANQRRVTHALSWLAGLVLLAGLTACTTPSPDLTSGLAVRGGPPGFTPREPSRPELSGYIAEGDGFVLEMVFDEAPDGGVEIDTVIDTGAAALLMPRLHMAEPWLAGGAQRYEGRLDRHGEIVLTLEAGPCAIGDLAYGHFALLAIGGRRYEGCARETGPHPLWTRQIGEFLPAIQACLAGGDSGNGGRVRVSLAYRQGGAVIVRTDNGGAVRRECEYDGARVRWRAVPGLQPALPGEGEPYFLPRAIPQDGEGCYLYEIVRDADRRVLGSLAHDGCAVPPVG